MNKKAEKILNSTIDLLIRDGVKKTSMDDIANYSNSSKVTVYKYFNDKDTLYFVAGKSILSLYMGKIENLIDSDENFIKKLFGFLDIISEFANTGNFDLCRELAGYNPGIKSEFELYLQTYKSSLIVLINEGIKNGLIIGDLDSESLFFYIDMSIVYYYQDNDYREKMNSNADFRDRFLQFFIGNIFIDSTSLLKDL